MGPLKYCLLVLVVTAGCGFTPGAFPTDAQPQGPTLAFVSMATTADEASGSLMIEVALSEEPVEPVTVGYRLAGGSATDGSDFTFTPGMLTLTTTSPQTFEVAILPDGLAEQDETIVVELHSAVGATIEQGTHTITVSANTLPRVAFTQAASQLDESATTVMIDVVLDAAAGVPVEATYVVTGTAVDGTDYTIAQGPVMFAAGETMAQIPVTIMEDVLPELGETVVLDLSSATAAIIGTTATHTLTINDSDPDPTVSFTAASGTQVEDNAAVVLTVSLSAPSGKPITVPFARDPTSTATIPDDYAFAATADLVFAAGVTSQTITINVAEDTIDEDDETAITTLGTPTNATLDATPSHTLTITDDDQVCFGPAAGDAARVCLERGPTQAVTLPANINTDNSALCETAQPTGWTAGGQPASCFIKGTTITVNTTTVQGSRPLVLVASTSITIATLLDASSDRVAGTTGPDSPGSPCGFGSNPQNSAGTDSGGGGGAGGTLGSRGGAGGDGSSGNRNGGTAGTAIAATTLLRAGCDGQRGGTGETGGQAGLPGRGGGAVYLVSAGSIVMNANAIINASGSGANGSGSDRNGGSGGGSGGMIRLYAASFTAPATAKLVANGGGGSGGASGGTNSQPGADPVPSTPTTQAQGGSGGSGTGGGDGFAGSSAATAGGNGDSNDGGAGGGGGGGIVRSNLTVDSAVTSAGAILISP